MDTEHLEIDSEFFNDIVVDIRKEIFQEIICQNLLWEQDFQ